MIVLSLQVKCINNLVKSRSLESKPKIKNGNCRPGVIESVHER